MHLGWYELSLDVKDIQRSCDFYTKLGFELVDNSVEDRTATVQRGNCRIGLFNGRAPETILDFWQGDVQAIADDLIGKGLRFERGPSSDDKGTGALLRDPDGLAIHFVNLRGMTRTGPPMKGDRKLGWFITTLAVKDLERSVAFYQKLGFKLQPGSPDPGHVATLGKDDCTIGLYQGIIEPDKLQLAFWQGDVDATSAEFAGKGLHFERGPSSDETGTGAVLKDPDGNTVHLINVARLRRTETR
jgi:lactoylglutathione lyase